MMKGWSPCVLYDRLSGIRMAHPSAAMKTNMFRHILHTLRKMVASNPICSNKSCSFVTMSGITQANIPLPTTGGAC